MNIRPLDNRVAIRVDKPAEKKGSILIPESAQEKPHIGVVIAVGPGKLLNDGRRIPPEVSVGDKVWFSKYGGLYHEEQRDLYVIHAEEILGVIEDA
jgi:chaperonin GroES